MKRITTYFLLLSLAVVLGGAATHKYYVAVFQVEYAPKKKALQMTSRIFIDDLEAAFSKRYNKKFYIGDKRELAETGEYLQQYISDKVKVKVNGKAKPVKYLKKETENDVLICYYTVEAGSKVTSVEVSNSVLMDVFPEQQNIVHVKINSNKKSLLLTNDKPQGLLDF